MFFILFNLHLVHAVITTLKGQWNAAGLRAPNFPVLSFASNTSQLLLKVTNSYFDQRLFVFAITVYIYLLLIYLAPFPFSVELLFQVQHFNERIGAFVLSHDEGMAWRFTKNIQHVFGGWLHFENVISSVFGSNVVDNVLIVRVTEGVDTGDKCWKCSRITSGFQRLFETFKWGGGYCPSRKIK